MTFPTIPTSGAGRIISVTQPNTTSTRTFPDLSTLTKNSGDILIALVCCYGTSQTNVWSAWGGGFTEFADNGSSGVMTWGGAWKVSTGSETGTFTVTQGGTVGGDAEMIVMSIPGGHLTSPPEVTALATNSTSAANPAALTPSWGADDTLWISCVGNGETASAALVTITPGAPTNYGNAFTVGASDTAKIGEIDMGVAFRQLNTATEDVGTWTVDTTSARNSAFVIAVRPIASGAASLTATSTLTTNATVTTYDSTVLADSPLVYLKLDETSGTTAADSSGNSRPGTYVNGTLGQAAVMPTGTASYLSNSNNQYVTIANASWQNQASWTVECWVKFTNLSSYHNVFNRDGSAVSRGWNLYSNGTEMDGFDGSGDILTSGAGLATSTSYLLAITCDSSTLKLYKNGVLQRSTTATNSWTTNASGSSSTNALLIGCSFAGSGSAQLPTNGYLERYAYYGSVLSGTRLLAHYDAGTGNTGSSANLTATSTLTATGTKTAVAVAALTATSTLTDAGTVTQLGTVTLTATSTLTVAAVVARPGAASLTATSTLTTAASVIATGSGQVDLAGTSTLTAAGTKTAFAAASLTSTSTLTTAATATYVSSVSLSATSTLTCAATVTTITSSGYDVAVAALSPTHYYKTDETTGTSFHDSGSGANDGTLTGSHATLNTTILGEKGVEFTVDDTYISAAIGSIAVAGSWSCLMHVYSDTGNWALIGYAQGGDNTPSDSGDRHLGVSFGNSHYASEGVGSGSGIAMPAGSYHIVGTQASGGSQKVYVNGTLASTASYTPGTATGGALYFPLGAFDTGVPHVAIGKVAFWDGVALTSGNVATLYAAVGTAGVTTHSAAVALTATSTLTATPVAPLGIVLAGTSQTGTWSVGLGQPVGTGITELVIIDPTQTRAPTSVQIIIYNCFANETLTISIDGIDVYTVTADVNGYVAQTSIPVYETTGLVLNAGTHTLTATGPISTASDTFTLAHNPDAHEIVQGPDVDPVEIPEATATPTRRWVLQDLLPGGLGSWAMPINPKSVDWPGISKTLTPTHATAITGTRYVTQGGYMGFAVSFTGYCPNQAFQEHLEAYAALERRIYVIDDQNRAWTIAILGADITLRKRQRNNDGSFEDWAADYSVNCWLFNSDYKTPVAP